MNAETTEPGADTDATPQDQAKPEAPKLRGADLIRKVGFWTIVREDLRTHENEFFSAGFAALFWYRYGAWADMFKFKPLRWPLTVPYVVFQRFVQLFYGIELVRSTQVGRRLRLVHQHGIVIHHLADIGDDVVIRHGVTFGMGSEWTWKGPVIGDRVSFSPGVIVIGDVHIGDDVSIGPNCVVSTNVPPNRNLFIPPPRSFPKQVETPAESEKTEKPAE